MLYLQPFTGLSVDQGLEYVGCRIPLRNLRLLCDYGLVTDDLNLAIQNRLFTTLFAQQRFIEFPVGFSTLDRRCGIRRKDGGIDGEFVEELRQAFIERVYGTIQTLYYLCLNYSAMRHIRVWCVCNHSTISFPKV